jgi:hypothetical protein
VYATKARKNGLVSLEDEALAIEDPFLRKALNLAVDGTDLQDIRKMLELEIALEEHHAEAEAKVFDSAGGYSPTIGIIGAVMGLIQVMKNLANIDEVGRGIAVAFVATVYGVAAANLFFLPAASKIKARATGETQRKELILEGVSGIVEVLNPKLIRIKLEAFTPKSAARSKKQKQAQGAAGAVLSESSPAEIYDDSTTPRQRSRESRALAGFLRRFHHAAVRVLCGDVRQLADRQRQSAAGFGIGKESTGRRSFDGADRVGAGRCARRQGQRERDDAWAGRIAQIARGKEGAEAGGTGAVAEGALRGIEERDRVGADPDQHGGAWTGG